jgi:hypothetical protein
MKIHRIIVGAVVAAYVAAVGFVYFFAPPPPSARAQLAASQVWAGTSGGTANAQTLNIHNVVALNDLLGVPIRFLPGNTNTNTTPAALTLTINLDGGGTIGPVTVNRKTPNLGLQACSGAEFQSGILTEVTYDGTVFEINTPIDYTPVGKSIELRQSSLTAPPGYLIEDGTCYSRTGYPALFSSVGTTYNAGAPSACSGSQFAAPFSNGTAFVALDNQGANTANKITNAGSGCTFTSVGAFCGNQNGNILQTHLPNIGLPVSDPGHTHVLQIFFNTESNGTGTNFGFFTNSGSSSPLTTNTATTGITVRTGGSNTPFPILQPIQGGLRAIKY